MKVYVVTGGCRGDEHIIAVCKTPDLAEQRCTTENRKCHGLGATYEEWTVEENK